MGKLHPSRAAVAESKYAASEARCARLEAELQRVKEMHKQSWTQRSGRRSASRRSTASVRSSDGPSYLRPTEASKSRAEAKTSTSSSEETESKYSSIQTSRSGLRYDDGRLVVQEPLEDANFMRQTRASNYRRRDNGWNFGSRREIAASQSARLRTTEPNYDDDPWMREEPLAESPPQEIIHFGPERYMKVCQRCDYLDKAYEDKTGRSLAARFRLDDNVLLATRTALFTVPSPFQHHLLASALRLAQKTLWEAFRTHWPHIHLRSFPEGPEQVRLGRQEVDFTGLSPGWLCHEDKICGGPRRTVTYAILKMPDLRNRVCHPGYMGASGVDSLLRDAQHLAVVLQDEKIAFKVRALRDKLRNNLNETLEYIKANIGVFALPNAKPWPHYLQRLFKDANHEIRKGYADQYPKEVIQAAYDWELNCSRPGELNPEYVARVHDAIGLMRSNARGGQRALSLSTLPGLSRNDGENAGETTGRRMSAPC